MQPSTSERSLSIAVVLVLVAALVVLLPSASPTGSFDGLVTAAEASNFPAPSMPLPPCDPVTGSGGCVRSQDMSVGVSGQVSDVGSTLMVSGSGLPACVMLYDYEATQTPDPCHTSVGTSVTGCLVVDLWADTSGAGAFASGGGCGVTFAESAETSAGTRNSCDGSGNFGTYIYGGPANVAGARWSERSAGLEANCTLTVTGMPSGALSGPAWVRISRVASGWSDYYGARESVSGVADAWVPVQVDVRNRGPIVECEAEDIGGGRYRFSVTSIEHPLGLGTDDIRWWFGTGDEGFDETVGTGSSVEFEFPEDAYVSWVDWLNVTVTDSDGVGSLCRADRPEPSSRLDVTLSRDATDPVLVDEPFDVELTVSAPADNPDDVLGIAAVEFLELPEWLELVDGELVGGFDLPPGEQRTTTLSLQASDAKQGSIRSAWSGLTPDDETISGEGTLEIEAVGTFDGEWFRTDGLGEGLRQEETVPVRLRVENETGAPMTGLKLTASSVSGFGDTPGTAVLDAPSPTTEGRDDILSLPAELDASGPGSVGFVDFDLEGVEEGDIRLSAAVEGTAPSGNKVEGTIEADWVVRSTDLTVAITFDPRSQTQTESEDPEADPEPVEMTATVNLTNTSGGKLTDIRIEEFEITRAIGEQQLFVDQVGGLRLTNWDAPGILLSEPTDTDDPPEPFDLEDGEERSSWPTSSSVTTGSWTSTCWPWRPTRPMPRSVASARRAGCSRRRSTSR